MNRLTRLITCTDISHAYILKGKLNNEGIDCMLTNENMTNLNPHYNNMLGGGVQILVFEEDLDAAREIIHEDLEPEKNIAECPYCGSTNISYGMGAKKGLKFLNIILFALSNVPFSHIRPKYYCKDCKQEFNGA